MAIDIRTDLGERPRILVIRRDNIGDLLLTTPALSLLRQRYPRAHIAALVNTYNAPVLRGNPDLDEIFTYTKAKHRAAGESLVSAWCGKWRTMREIRGRRFDLAIVATAAPTPGWLQLARASRARHTLAAVAAVGAPTGVDLPVVRDARFDGRHAVEQTALLLTALGIDAPPGQLTLCPEPHALAAAERLWAAAGFAPGAVRLGIHISARKPRQRWPAERFPRLMRRLHEATGCVFALFWSPGAANDPRHPGDDELAQAVLRESTGIPVLPMPTQQLDELVAGLATVHSVVCSDGGAMHIAAALGKPMVCFFGNSDPALWHPWGVAYRLLRPASETVADITLEEAEEAVLEMLRTAR